MFASNPAAATKKHRSADERGLQFSINIELLRSQDNWLLAIKDRLKMANDSLKLSKKTSKTQNTDLIAILLLAFEEKMQRREGSSSFSLQSSTSSTSTSSSSSCSSHSDCSSIGQPVRSAPFSSPIPQHSSFCRAMSTPVTHSSAFYSPSALSPTSPQEIYPRKFQLSTPATEDDEIYLCSEGAL